MNKNDEQNKPKKIKTAVALKYDPDDNAPTIVATGKGVFAEKIIKDAEEKGIPVKEEASVAEGLSKIEVGTEIPPEFYQIVAEILVFVNQVNEEWIDRIINRED